MSELVIETSGLRKTYVTRRGRQVALDGLDLSVPRGGVHGFLGPERLGQDHHDPDGARASRRRRRDDAAVRHRGPAAPAVGDRPGGRGGRAAAAVPGVLRAAQPAPAGSHHRRGPQAGRRGARDRRPERARQGPLQGVLARHEAAAGDRRDAAEATRPARAGRADERPRPVRHPRDPRHGAVARGRRHDGPDLVAPPLRGAAGVRLGVDHRTRSAARRRFGGRRPARHRAGFRTGRAWPIRTPARRCWSSTAWSSAGTATCCSSKEPPTRRTSLACSPSAGTTSASSRRSRHDLESVFLEVTEGEGLR